VLRRTPSSAAASGPTGRDPLAQPNGLGGGPPEFGGLKGRDNAWRMDLTGGAIAFRTVPVSGTETSYGKRGLVTSNRFTLPRAAADALVRRRKRTRTSSGTGAPLLRNWRRNLLIAADLEFCQNRTMARSSPSPPCFNGGEDRGEEVLISQRFFPEHSPLGRVPPFSNSMISL
jgi:hypothetical protein